MPINMLLIILKLLFISLNELNEEGSFNTKCKVECLTSPIFFRFCGQIQFVISFHGAFFPPKKTGNDRYNLFNTTLEKVIRFKSKPCIHGPADKQDMRGALYSWASRPAGEEESPVFMGQQTSRMEVEPYIHESADQQDEKSPVFMGQQTSRMEGEPCIHEPADQQNEGSPVFIGQQTSRMKGALYSWASRPAGWGEPCIHGPADQQDEGSPVLFRM